VDKTASIREVGRLLLHLGLIILLLGVFMSENIVYENVTTFSENDVQQIAPGISMQVTNIDMQYFVDDSNYTMIVTVHIIETDISNTSRILGTGNATITGTSHGNLYQVYIQSDSFRDVFVSISNYTQIGPDTFQAIVHAKIMPFVSFVWLGASLMVLAIIPMIVIETNTLLGMDKEQEKVLSDEVIEDSEIAA
jgi:cytochrome c biogenesis factor